MIRAVCSAKIQKEAGGCFGPLADVREHRGFVLPTEASETSGDVALIPSKDFGRQESNDLK